MSVASAPLFVYSYADGAIVFGWRKNTPMTYAAILGVLLGSTVWIKGDK